MKNREMPCLMLRSETNYSSPPGDCLALGSLDELADLRVRKEGFLQGGLLMPLGWREFLATDDVFPRAVDSDWEEDDDVVDDDEDEDEEEEDEDEDDFLPGDGDELEEEEDDDDDDEDEEEE